MTPQEISKIVDERVQQQEPFMPHEVQSLVAQLRLAYETRPPIKRYLVAPEKSRDLFAFLAMAVFVAAIATIWITAIVTPDENTAPERIHELAEDVEDRPPGEWRESREGCRQLAAVMAEARRLEALCTEKEKD